MRELTVIVNARVNSTRIPRKIVRPFADSTLLDICLNKLLQLDMPVYLACCEKEILEIYEKYKSKIELLPRDMISVEKGFRDQRITFKHYTQVPTPYIMSINPCLPFMKLDTYKKAITEFVYSNYRTMTAVKRRSNIFFDKLGNVINCNPDCVSTQNQPILFEMAHAFHFFDRDYFTIHGKFWTYTKDDPALFEISEQESLDIDTPIDFLICETIYKEQIKGK